MVRWMLMLSAVLVLTACAGDVQHVVDPVTVDVPVYQRSTPPDELRTPIPAPAIHFVAPGDPHAFAALDKDGVTTLESFVGSLRDRIARWEAWAGDTGKPGQ